MGDFIWPPCTENDSLYLSLPHMSNVEAHCANSRTEPTSSLTNHGLSGEIERFEYDTLIQRSSSFELVLYSWVR